MITADRCHWVREQDGPAVLIPHCWQSVVSGPEFCTCPIVGSHLELAERALQIDKDEVERLRNKLKLAADRYEGQRLRNQQFHHKIRRLDPALADPAYVMRISPKDIEDAKASIRIGELTVQDARAALERKEGT